ncbi:phage integrase SAM-like domain-containing protein [Halobacillus halophilus]|uniref:phage integrase SAM-like domain-containing protein n=1 Tax=Halobacillus halophilus TaxID=1570 RepID=UPI001CD33C05|nr:phage integrase SAM-like domain-containing protein [Halobacillus halophilus]MCA1011394.1 phage integrase SAM-like domain-containing protein [Halobacillus halophilus]
MRLDELFETFLSIKSAEGRAESTMKQYNENFSFFMRYLNEKKIDPTFEDLNRNVFRDYIRYMREAIVTFDTHKYKSKSQRRRGLSPNSINTRLKTLRVMFLCLYEEEITDVNSIDGVKNLPNPQGKSKFLRMTS